MSAPVHSVPPTGPGIGHNGGPGLQASGWARYCWTRARAELFPRLPVEVVRLRVARARALGMDYRTYAGVRAASGHDLAAFLYSTNLLGMLRAAEADQARLRKLSGLGALSQRLAVQPPLQAGPTKEALIAQGLCVDIAAPAPNLRQRRDEIRARLAELVHGVPASRVLVLAETALEAEWAEIGRLAGVLPADRYFALSPNGAGL